MTSKLKQETKKMISETTAEVMSTAKKSKDINEVSMLMLQGIFTLLAIVLTYWIGKED